MKSYLGVLVLGVSCLFLSLYYIFGFSLSSDSLVSQQRVLSAFDSEYTKGSRVLPGDSIHPVAPAPEVYGAAQRNKILKRSEGRRQWTGAEDGLLIDLKDGHDLPWNKIAESFPTRSLGALQVRYGRLKTYKVGQGKKLDYWTPQEDGRLFKLVGKGLSAEAIAGRFSKRSVASIKSRYYYLTGEAIDPSKSSKRGKKFTAEEEKLLLKLGEKNLTWKEKAKFFNNRSEQSIYQRYQRLEQNRKSEP